MLPSHAPKTAKLQALRSGAKHARSILAPYLLVGCDTSALKDAATKLDAIRQMLSSLEVDLDTVLAERQVPRQSPDRLDQLDAELTLAAPTPSYGDPFDPFGCGLSFSFNPGVDSAPVPHDHPPGCACPGCINRDLRCLAVTNTSLDDERRCG